MNQRHAMAALGLVEIRRRHHNGESVDGEMRQRVPEFAPRNRIDARGRLIEQQHARLRHQCARQRQLLFHAAAQPPRQPVGEAIHVEHGEIAMPALGYFGRAKHAAGRRCSWMFSSTVKSG